MGFGGTGFATRKKIGQWGEDTFEDYFHRHKEHGLRTLKYGEAFAGKKKQETDAVSRPDLLVMEAGPYDRLAREDPTALSTDLRTLPDADPIVKRVVAASLVAVEVKFSHREYRVGHVNFIVDDRRKAGYEKWLGRTQGIGEIVIWLTTDRGFMAPMGQVLSEGEPIVRSYENRGGKAMTKGTWNLPVEQAQPFANVVGYVLNTTLKPSLKVIPTSGAIEFDVTDDLGDFADVDLVGFRAMAKGLRRP